MIRVFSNAMLMDGWIVGTVVLPCVLGMMRKKKVDLDLFGDGKICSISMHVCYMFVYMIYEDLCPPHT